MNFQTVVKNRIGIILTMVLFGAIYGVGSLGEKAAISQEAGLNNDNTLVLDSIRCKTRGGFANDTGLKVWCWDGLKIPKYSGQQGVAFSEGQLKVDSECDEKQVIIVGDHLTFSVDPTNAIDDDWCSKAFNMRAEIRTVPWHINHKKGTEEWFGWSYTFDEDYIIDRATPWLFFQVHPGIRDVSPHTALWVIKENQFEGHNAGEIFVVNTANDKEYNPTGMLPKAGETINLVVHAIWGDKSNGLLQVWINGISVYDRQVATIFKKYPWGGNAKWGIYKWRWANAKDVQKSLQKGVNNLRTSMGSLRIITRMPNDPEYGKSAYSSVEPQ